MRIKAVAFDIDGTLYRDAALYVKVLPFVAANLPLLRAFAGTRQELHRLSADEASRASLPTDLAGFRAFQARLLAPKLGIGAEEAEALIERVMYHELEGHFGRVAPYPGVLPTLRGLRDSGLRLAALSDFPAPRKLELLGLRDCFEVASCTEESGRLKPAPDGFLALAGALGLEPGEILFVGNSARYDVAGSRSAGMVAAIRGHRDAPGASLRYRDWSRLLDFARRLAD